MVYRARRTYGKKKSTKQLREKENDRHVKQIVKKVMLDDRELCLQTAKVSSVNNNVQSFCSDYGQATTFIVKAETVPSFADNLGGIQTRMGDTIKLKKVTGCYRYFFQSTFVGDIPLNTELQMRVIVYVGTVNLAGFQILAKEDDDVTGMVKLQSPIKPEWKKNIVYDKILKLNMFHKGMNPIIYWKKNFKGMGKTIKFSAENDTSPEDWHVQSFTIIEALTAGGSTLVAPQVTLCGLDKYYFYNDD